MSADRASFDDRVHGAWLGRCVANTMGKPVVEAARVVSLPRTAR